MYDITKVKPGEDLGDILNLREEIFGIREDDLDDYGISLLLTGNGDPVAIGRILLDPENDRLIIDQIGVKENLRRQGIGTEVLNCMMEIAISCRAEEVRAKARNDQVVIAFLEKNGFEDFDHFWMTKDLYY